MLTIKLRIVTKDVISLSVSVLLLFRHYISHKITFGAPSSGGVLRSACGAFIVLSCVCYVLCASVYMCFVVTCWERADLLALVCGVFCEFVTFPFTISTLIAGSRFTGGQ